MKRLALLLLLIIACVPVPKQPQEQAKQSHESIPSNPLPVPTPSDTMLPTRTVTVSDGSEFKLTEDNRLVSVSNATDAWVFRYQNGELVELASKGKDYEFIYNRTKLEAIELGGQKLTFRYDGRGRLVEARGGQEPLYFDYDSLDQIRAVRRGVAGKTSLDYDKQGKLKYVTKGLRSTNVIYRDDGSLINLDADDVKWIFAYWRDGKLSSLTGKSFGLGIAVSYGPDYPPRDAEIKSADDDRTFNSAYKDTLYTIVDQYVYCKYVRQLKTLLFEGESYAFYVTYFKGDMTDYLAMNIKCKVYGE